MEFNISGKNEFTLIPEIGNNKEIPHNQQFRIVHKKLSNRLHSGKWSSFDATGKFSYDIFAKVREHVIRIENPPKLKMKDGQHRSMTIDDLCNESYHELYPVVEQIIDAIELSKKEGIDSKK